MLFTLCESFAWQTLASLGLISIILFGRRSNKNTLGARDFSSAVSGFCQVFIVTRASPLVASAYGRRCVGLRPTPKIPAAREKNLWYPGQNKKKRTKTVIGYGVLRNHPISGVHVHAHALV